MVITSAVLSFDQADRLIRNFIDSTISARHLQDLTAEIGAELTKLRDKQTKEYLYCMQGPTHAITWTMELSSSVTR